MHVALPHTALPALAEGLEKGLRVAPKRGEQRECRRNRTPGAAADFAHRTTEVLPKPFHSRQHRGMNGENEYIFTRNRKRQYEESTSCTHRPSMNPRKPQTFRHN